MFARVHLVQEENWRPDKAAITIYNNFLLTQREQEGMISPKKIIVNTNLTRCSNAEDLIGGIRDIGY